MGVPNTNDNIQIKIKILNPSQEPPLSSKAQNQGEEDMDVLYTFKIKIKRQNLDCWCMKEQLLFPNQDKDAKYQSRTSRVLQSQESGLKGHGCSLYLKYQDSQNSDHGCIKDQRPYPNQHQDAKPR